MIKKQGKLDSLLLLIVVALVIFGVVMVFSASYYSTMGTEEGPYQYLLLSGRWALIGFALMIVASFVPYRAYYNLAPILLAAALFFLFLLRTPLGENVNGATRWIKIGVGDLTFMPGEFAKLAVIIFCAWYYTKYADLTKSFLRGLCLPMAVALVFFYLIYKQPNLSTAIIVTLTIIIMMYIAGVNFAYLAGIIAVGGVGLYFVIQAMEGEHLSRISGFWDPFADAQGEFFQTVQSLLALGSGGLVGVGLGNSVEKALWLPSAQNDFIFAVIGEETGFIGCILVILAFTLLVWRCMFIAMRSKDRFAMLIGAGVAALFAVQVSFNIGVVTAILPPTGVILPFISYGGNAILLFMFLIGIMLNISRGDGHEAEAKRKKRRREEAA